MLPIAFLYPWACPAFEGDLRVISARLSGPGRHSTHRKSQPKLVPEKGKAVFGVDLGCGLAVLAAGR